jgi:hypothetical protein
VTEHYTASHKTNYGSRRKSDKYLSGKTKQKEKKKKKWNEEAEALKCDRKKDRKQDDSDRSKLLTKQNLLKKYFCFVDENKKVVKDGNGAAWRSWIFQKVFKMFCRKRK